MSTQSPVGAVVISAAELEFIVFMREFKVWLAMLSGPARRTLEQMPAERQMLLARKIVDGRMQDVGTGLIWISGSPNLTNIIPFGARQVIDGDVVRQA